MSLQWGAGNKLLWGTGKTLSWGATEGMTGNAAQDATPVQAAAAVLEVEAIAGQDATPGQTAVGELAVSGTAAQNAEPAQIALGELPIIATAVQDVSPFQVVIGGGEQGLIGAANQDVTPAQTASGALVIAGSAAQDITPQLLAGGEFATLGLPMEAAFIALILSDPAVAAIAGSRVFPMSRPQGSVLPAITSTRISGGPLYADEGEVGLEYARIQVDCWASTYGAAKLLAQAVTGRLSGFEGTIAGKVFQDISLDLEQDLREGGGDAAQYPFRTALDFIVWVER
jgi:hypothetical protein